MLKQIIDQEKERDICLEVAVKNPKALKLYERVGFQVTEMQDYYLVNPNKKVEYGGIPY